MPTDRILTGRCMIAVEDRVIERGHQPQRAARSSYTALGRRRSSQSYIGRKKETKWRRGNFFSSIQGPVAFDSVLSLPFNLSDSNPFDAARVSVSSACSTTSTRSRCCSQTLAPVASRQHRRFIELQYQRAYLCFATVHRRQVLKTADIQFQLLDKFPLRLNFRLKTGIL